MTGESSTRIVNKIVIRSRIEDIWRELTKNDEPQAAIFNACHQAEAGHNRAFVRSTKFTSKRTP
ncbi:MAG: hypothetical protein ACXW16_11915 [Burkholderiaceae bacterium]